MLSVSAIFKYHAQCRGDTAKLYVNFGTIRLYDNSNFLSYRIWGVHDGESSLEAV